MSKISIRDIAKKAGVSVSSVSLAFHRPYQLSNLTKDKILAIASEMGYSPKQARNSKIMRNIVIAVPAMGYKSTMSYFTTALAEKISEKDYKAIIVYYKSQKELDIKISAIENDPLALGLIVIFNEKENYYYTTENLPMVVVSPHSNMSSALNVGCNFINDTMLEIEKLSEVGAKQIGVLIDNNRMSFEYFQQARDRLAQHFTRVTGGSYNLDLICSIKPEDDASEKIKQFVAEQKPDAWIVVGMEILPSLLLNVNESISGIVLIEEGIKPYSVEPHSLLFLERPTSKIAESSVDSLFKMIDNKIHKLDDKIIIESRKHRFGSR